MNDAEAPLSDDAGTDITKIELKKGVSYLLVDRVEDAYALFKHYSRELRGMCVTRTPPEEIEHMYHVHNVTFKWLTHMNVDQGVRPTELHILFPSIQAFMDEGDFIIILDGLEYLKVHNGFDEILKFIQSFRDHVYMKKGLLLVPVYHDALTPMEISLIRRDLMPIEDIAKKLAR